MSDFAIALTDAGAALMAALIAAEEPLVITQMAIGDGELGETDPATLTALISQEDIQDVSGVTSVDNTVTVRGDFSNAGLETGYPVREIGIFAAPLSAGADILLAYANAGEEATFMPPAGGTALNLVVAGVLVISGDLVVTVTAEASTYVTLAQWSVHLSGAGGVDQHPLVTVEDPGLMSAADKVRLDGLLSGAQYILARDEKAAGTNGGTFTSGAWRTRDLNALVADETGVVTLAGNQITLPAGTYYAHILAPAHKVERHRAALYNVTDALYVEDLIGQTTKSDQGTDDTTSVSVVLGRFVIAAAKAFEVRHRCELTQSGSGFGLTASGLNFGIDEVYTILQLWRVPS